MPSRSAPGRTLAVIGHGFIGSRVARLAVRRGWEVRVLTRTLVSAEAVEVVVGDAQDRGAVREVLRGVDHVVYAAGTAKPADSNVDPVGDAVRNLEPLLAVLEATRASSVTGFTFLSSGGTVYGPDAPVPTSEDAPLWPISSYGIMKVAAERYVAMHAREGGFAADLLRCANAYGPGGPTSGSQGLVGIARSHLAAGLPVTVYGDGSARRDYIHVDDLADIVVRLAEEPDGVRVLNVGSGRATSITEIIDALSAELGVTATLDRRPARTTDVQITELDITRLRAVLDVQPRQFVILPKTS